MAKIKARLSTTITLDEAFPEFLNACRVKNLAGATIKTYTEKFRKLCSIICVFCCNDKIRMVHIIDSNI